MGHRHHIRGAKPKWWERNVPSSPPISDEPSILEAHTSAAQPYEHHHDLGIKAVLIHLLGDALNNVGVIIAAAVIWKAKLTKRFYADPAMSMVIGIMLILTAWKLSMSSASMYSRILTCATAMKGGRILMLSEPENVDVADVKHDLEKVIFPLTIPTIPS